MIPLLFITKNINTMVFVRRVHKKNILYYSSYVFLRNVLLFKNNFNVYTAIFGVRKLI